MNNIGSGIYLRASMFNHSCVPNCTILFDKSKMLYVRVIEDRVKPGDALTINYVDLMDTTEGRRTKLQNQYHFTCKCERCQTEKEEKNDNVESMLEIARENRKKESKF